jgi:hypothetical protein
MNCRFCNTQCKYGHGSICVSCRVKIRRYRIKQALVEYKGSACEKCGFVGVIEVYDFHHVESSQKEFSISHSLNRSWEEIKKEADKCVMLCANCHRAIHHPHNETKEYALNNYKGNKNFDLVTFENYMMPFVYKCDCGNLISRKAKSCMVCRSKKREKINWLPVQQLIEMVTEIGYSATGRHFGVSGNVVKKRIKNHKDEQF